VEREREREREKERERGRDINLHFTILCISAFAGLDAFHLYTKVRKANGSEKRNKSSIR